MGLQQEHVVLVDVGADRAAGGGEADHDVVDAPARQEAELLQQRGHVRIPFVDVLDQQGPVMVGQAGEVFFLEWAGAHVPAAAAAVVADQPRQHAVLAGQAGQVVGHERGLEAGEGVADQQRALVPVVAQEQRRVHAQRRQGGGIDLERQGGGGSLLAGAHEAISS